jgi:hypothetical protein
MKTSKNKKNIAKMNQFLIILFLFFYSNFYSQNDEWVHVGNSIDNTAYYVRDVKEDTTYSTTCWVKAVIPSKKYKNKKGKWVTTYGNSQVERWVFYCSEKKYNVTTRILF